MIEFKFKTNYIRLNMFTLLYEFYKKKHILICFEFFLLKKVYKKKFNKRFTKKNEYIIVLLTMLFMTIRKISLLKCLMFY